MNSLGHVLRVLTEMRESGVVGDYAIGGATAVLFSAEPTRTYDVDVFVTLPSAPDGAVVSLTSVYDWAKARGILVQGEHLIIEGVPVQLLPVYNALVEEAVVESRVHDYEGVLVHVVDPEHLVALALQAGGRGAVNASGSCWSSAAWTGSGSGRFSPDTPCMPKSQTMSEHSSSKAAAIFERKRVWHQAQARLPLRDKVRILLDLQRQELPLLARRRPLRPWERPWEITP